MFITSVPSTNAKESYYEISPVRVESIDFDDTKSLGTGLYRRVTHFDQSLRLQICTKDAFVAGSVAHMQFSGLL